MTYAIPTTIIGALILLAMCVRHVWRKSEITDPAERQRIALDCYAISWSEGMAEGLRDLSTPAASPRIGPGKRTIFTDHNYINDPRRKWYGAASRRE